jgi:FkbM family methyltransferase
MNKIMANLYGNRLGQNMLESIVRKCHRYMGIGTGDDVYFSGEKYVIERLEYLNTPPFTIFDVGSHRGQYLDVVLSVMGQKNFRIHCFEPSKRVFSSLEERAGNDCRVIVNNLGLGKITSQMELYYDSKDSSGCLTKRKLDHFGITNWQSETVSISTVDEYCTENKIYFIHLLKADIEGHEMDLFEGASQMFQKKAIKIVTFEFGGCNIDTKIYFQDYFYFFHGLKMDLYRITPSGYYYPLPDYREIDEQFRTTNFVAIDNNI